MAVAEEKNLARTPHLRDFAAQGAVFSGLMPTLREGTFVHAYLISGMRGVGKRTLARLMAQYILCRGEKGDEPCGECPACMRVLDGTHPDVVRLLPEKDKKNITVEQVRALVALAGEHTYEGGRRILLIEQAERMNPQAQNALLKTLEEPQAENVFLLLCEDTSLLLPTIVSRCRGIKLHPWPDDVVLHALELAGTPPEHRAEAAYLSGGSIGQALEMAGDTAFWQRREEVMRDFFALTARSPILGVSNQWKDRREQAEELLRDVEEMLRTLWLAHVGMVDFKQLAAYPEPWQRLARQADDATFARLMDAVFEARRRRNNQVTWQAVVEGLLLHMTEELQPWRR